MQSPDADSDSNIKKSHPEDGVSSDSDNDIDIGPGQSLGESSPNYYLNSRHG